MRSIAIVLLSLLLFSFQTEKKPVNLVISASAHPRVKYGADQLVRSLTDAGYEVKLNIEIASPGTHGIIITHAGDKLADQWSASSSKATAREGFEIFTSQKNIIIQGADESGALYGCLELAGIIKERKLLPADISLKDAPKMTLRGTCIGLQKTNYLPGRTVYEYPYTPENFPWFYDKTLWIRYLDSLAVNRYNSLYLWNGHPFASLVKLRDYPYAVEVDEPTFKKNEEIFRFLTVEADKRGIWVIQMFYNVILSKPFAERHGLKTQDRAIKVTPLVADYTRKSIAAFVEKYPNVGLLVTLGEALEGEEQEVDWFTNTIIAGVRDGLRATKRTDEPPIVLRGHDTNPQRVMKAALPFYNNLYTENKYNGEALTTYEPRGPWAQMHRELSELGSVHIDNVHILANLEPFRYGAVDFIRKSVAAMKKIHGANGLHLYPESSYWEWPYTADNTTQRLLQIERDWIWYRSWARYAWNAERDPAQEARYWSMLLASQFGSSFEAGGDILTALEEAGEIAPKLLRRFGITNGNRQTLTLGMTMSQLVNPHKYRVWPELYSSDGPEGEMLIEYASREWEKKTHTGETPVQVIRETADHAEKSVNAIRRAERSVSRDTAEFRRLRNDIFCYSALARHFHEKVLAANLVLRFKYSNELTDLRGAVSHLEKSVEIYRELANLTGKTYLYANSMQTGQRKIPVGGDGGRNKTWIEILPFFERELLNFKRNIDSLSREQKTVASHTDTKIENANITVLTKDIEFYTVDAGQNIFRDTLVTINNFPKALTGLRAIKFAARDQLAVGTRLTFKTDCAVQVLVGYFSEKLPAYVQPSNLETDASANDHGQAEVKITNALDISQMPNLNVHSFAFQPGTHTMTFNKGLVLILGFVNASVPIDKIEGLRKSREVDWLFE